MSRDVIGLPVALVGDLLAYATREGDGTEDQQRRAAHTSNEKEISHGRVSRQTR